MDESIGVELKELERKLEEMFRDYPVCNFYVWKQTGSDLNYMYMVFEAIESLTLETARRDLQNFKKLCRDLICELQEQCEMKKTNGKESPSLRMELIEECKERLKWTLEDYLGKSLYRKLQDRSVLVFKRKKYGAGCYLSKDVSDEIGLRELLSLVRDKIESLRDSIPPGINVSSLKRMSGAYITVERLFV